MIGMSQPVHKKVGPHKLECLERASIERMNSKVENAFCVYRPFN